jgi:chemotaxis-related protein WspB
MLLLQFQAGSERYGLDVSQVVEVSSLVSLRPIPHAPPEAAGVFNYRGILTPVVDLTTSAPATFPIQNEYPHRPRLL